MSGAAFGFTEEQRANYRLDCAEKAAAAARRAALREARQARGGAMSNAERQRAFVARANDLREIPAPADPEGREACRRDFLRFVHRYGAALLKDHAPAPLMCEKFLKPLQQSVLDGGQILVEMPRGKGKTTFIDLCAAWAVAYGHRRFVVLISATGKLAKVNLKNIMRVFLSPAFAADFPEISAPFLALDGKWQLCETQTFRGERTGIELKADRIVFPTVRGEDGAYFVDSSELLAWNNDNAALTYDGEEGWRMEIEPVGGYFNTVDNLQAHYLTHAVSVSAAVEDIPGEALASGYSFVAGVTPDGKDVSLLGNALSTERKALVRDGRAYDLEKSVNPCNVQVRLARATGLVTGSFSLWTANEEGVQKEISNIKHTGVLILTRDDYASLDAEVLSAGFFTQRVSLSETDANGRAKKRNYTASLPFNILAADQGEPDWYADDWGERPEPADAE